MNCENIKDRFSKKNVYTVLETKIDELEDYIELADQKLEDRSYGSSGDISRDKKTFEAELEEYFEK